MNIDYRKMFLALIAAVIISVPTAMVFKNHNNQLKAGQQERNRLQFDIKQKDEQQRQTDDALKQKADEAEKLKQENEQLKKDLQAKREKQERDAQLAAAQAQQPAAVAVAGNCETYRPLVQKYFGSATSAAMIVMQKESGCNPNAISATNDHGLFQLNGQAVYDPESNIRIAYAKYVSPRRGSNPNWSAWYAVCTPNLQPKYAGIWCS